MISSRLTQPSLRASIVTGALNLVPWVSASAAHFSHDRHVDVRRTYSPTIATREAHGPRKIDDQNPRPNSVLCRPLSESYPGTGSPTQGRLDWSLSRQQNGFGPSLGMWPEQLDPGITSGDDHSSSSKHLVCTPHRSTYVISSSTSGRSATSWNNLSSLTQFLAMPAVSISA